MMLRSLLLTGISLLVMIGTVRATPTDTLLDPNRHFIMPTAMPGNGGYFGFWELAFLQAGYSYDAFSFAGGITVMPTVAFRSQFAFLQGKVTLYQDPNFALAAGVNYLRLTSDYPYIHIFANMTVETPSHTRFTGMVLYKASGSDFPHPDVVPYGAFTFSYGGALGAGLGFDMPLPNNPNMYIVAEAWNHDLTSPNKLAVIGAFRLQTDSFSSDFGFMYFTLPLIAPVANFVYRF